ncbi:endolytic transglycosylase MltG, partial [Ruminococcaceae bacterium OttesenSCG-928-A11]|nr:endolytic transglycosylase MltG [Ruminococcaceae bacterium OttesenSCG-928-A11]
IEVEIRLGASTNEVAAMLKEEKLIKSNLAYIIYSRLTFSKISAGTHSVSPSMSIPEISAVLSGAGQTTYQLTILPEMDMIDIKELLKQYDFTDAEINSALTKQYNHPLLRDKPSGIDLEGYIFPDTYELEHSATVEDLFEMTFDNLYNKLSTDGSFSLMNSRGFDIHETLTLASIVTKEAPDEKNQKIIAGVLWNRLDIDMPLGCDPTYQYAYKMGYCGENLPSCDSTWNTRKHAGLPPGPIANMKYSTIQAVLKPTVNNYYYFVAGDGEYAGNIYYSATEAEHIQNTYNYCRELCR